MLFDKPLEVIIGMGTDINPAIVSVNTLVLFAVVPFNLLKGGLVYADAITTVSDTYAEEIKTPFYGEQLDGLMNVQEQFPAGYCKRD